MDLSKIPLLGMVTKHMDWLNQRQKVISQNIANSDTPDTLASASVASAPVASATGPSALGASAPAAFGTTSRFSTNSSLSATPPPPVASALHTKSS